MKFGVGERVRHESVVGAMGGRYEVCIVSESPSRL